jgi:sulfur carrier protein
VKVIVNGIGRDLPDSASVADAAALLTSRAEGIAVALNDSVVPRAEWAATPLADGDRVEVLTAVQGG